MRKTLLALSLMFGAAAVAQPTVVVPSPGQGLPPGYDSPDWPKLPVYPQRAPGKTKVEKPQPPKPALKPPQRPKELITV